MKTDGNATCQCQNNPCDVGQTCNDPVQSRTSLKDFTCTCDSNGLQATGGKATCTEDECAAALPPCGLGQACNDPDTSYTSKLDFVCTCDGNSSLTKVGGPARCESDECRNDPCNVGQVCKDPVTTRESLKDFTCTCDNGEVATGGAATCELDECEKQPCGSEQLCVDDDKRYSSRKNYLCECKTTGTKARGAPADCSPTATSAPGIDTTTPDTLRPATFPPGTPPTDVPPPTTSPQYTKQTTTPNSNTAAPDTPDTRAPEVEKVVVTAEKRTWNETAYKQLVSKKTGVPVDRIGVATTDGGDGTWEVTTTFTGPTDGAAVRLTEELKDPKSELRDMGVSAAGNLEGTLGDSSSGSSSDEDDGVPFWVWLLIALGALLCAGTLAGVAMKKKGDDNVTLGEFMETNEMCNTSPHESSYPQQPGYGGQQEFASI